MTFFKKQTRDSEINKRGSIRRTTMVVNPCEQPDLELFAEHRSDHCASSPKIGLNRPVFLNQIHRKSFLLGHTFGCFFHQLKIYVDSFFSPSENLSNRLSCNQRYCNVFLTVRVWISSTSSKNHTAEEL